MAGTLNILAVDTIEQRVELAHLPQGWFALLSIAMLLAVLAAVIVLYRREQRAGASARMRVVLSGLRCAVVVLLAVIWLQPILATYIHRKIEAATLVLVDGSASMSLRDRYPQPEDLQRAEKVAPGKTSELTRAQLVQDLLARESDGLLARLAASNQVRLFQFGEKVQGLGEFQREGGLKLPSAGGTESGAGDAGQDPASQPASGLDAITVAKAPVTDIGRAVRGAIDAQAGSPIAAVVVLSDGRFNQGESADVVGRYVRGKKIPIYTLGVGDPSPPRNTTVTSIEAPPNVFVKDPFKVSANLRAQGMDGTALTVELLERTRNSAEPRRVDSRQVTVEPGGRIPPVVFNRQIGEASEVTLQVRVVPDSAETLLDDNQKETTVRALDAKMRVLLVAGGPSWEYRYLSRLLQRDATMDVSCWLQSADEDAIRDGTTIIDHFPRTQEELFKHACVILLDPQPGDFDAGWASHIEAMVGSYGAGLIYAAGRKYAPTFSHDLNTRSLLDLLPVVIDANEADLILNDLGHFQSTAWPLTVPAEALTSPIVTLAETPGENAQVWARLPGVFWHYPVRREKPVASVLLRHSSPRMRNSYGGHVLLATQFFGSGRTAYMGFDSTWRWRRYGDRYFNRFWIQFIRYMVEGKLLTGQERGLIQVERDAYGVGEAVTVEARLLDPRHQPMTDPQVQAAVRVERGAEGASDRTMTLAAQPNRPGWYRGSFIAAQLGTHVIQIDLPAAEGGKPVTLKSQVKVGQPDLEFKQPELDRESLQTLALQSGGGKYLDIDEANQLPSLIPNRTTTLILTGSPVTLWDRSWMLLLLVGLLGLEWGLRKRARLL